MDLSTGFLWLGALALFRIFAARGAAEVRRLRAESAVSAQRFAHRLGRRIEPLSQECIRRLRAYGWPGNALALMSVIERAGITSQWP